MRGGGVKIVWTSINITFERVEQMKTISEAFHAHIYLKYHYLDLYTSHQWNSYGYKIHTSGVSHNITKLVLTLIHMKLQIENGGL